MLHSPIPSQVLSARENYSELLDLAARLTGARHAAFLPLDGPAGLLVNGTDPDLPPLYWEAALEVARNPVPLLFQSPGQRSFSPLLAVPVQYRNNLLGVMIISHRPKPPLNRDDLNLVALLAENPTLVSRNLAFHERNTIYQLESIQALVKTLEARDHYTGQHCRRVTELALHFARDLELSPPELTSVKTAGCLHDIGKVGISDHLLLKPGPLTREERVIIETHPLIGEKIVRPLGLKDQEREIILHHHERWDGQGYPQGLAGEEIPFLCRLVALADVFDALTSDRPYRRRFPIPAALANIRAGAGTHFDPDLAGKFITMISSQTQASVPSVPPSVPSPRPLP
jgi:putative nucleotidyltransferase with HDIG domain